MLTIEEAVSSPYLVLSIIGEHAGEGLDKISFRKQEEIKNAGKSFWLMQSYKAKPGMVQNLCAKNEKTNQPVYCLFLHPAQTGGARPTVKDAVANFSSTDSKTWEAIPNGIKVTGKIGPSSSALVFDELVLTGAPLIFDLWNYSEFGSANPIKMMLGASTVCCERRQSQGQRSHLRRVWAVAKLRSPYAVWLK
jgi:hypothetical protein